MPAPTTRRWDELYDLARDEGLTRAAARAYATVMWWGEHYGFRAARIISGRRSSSKQREMQRRWDRGDRAGMIVRPADDSTHTDGTGFDLQRVPHLAAYGELATYYPGLRWGGTFRTPDPVHFDLREQ